MATRKTTKDEAKLEQFPSDVGADNVEIAERTQDTDAESASYFTKVFLARMTDLKADPDLHERNYVAVLQEAIQRGLHPKGKVRFKGSEDSPDGFSKLLTYTVDVTPAHVDHESATTVTPSHDGTTDK